MTFIARFTVVAFSGALGLLLIAPQGANAQAQKKAAPPPAAQKQEAPPPPALKQMALTDKQLDSLLAAQKDLDAATEKLPQGAAEKPDAKLQAQFEAIAKKNGFADYAEYDNVYNNVMFVMSGIDPKTKAFTEPPAALQAQITQVEADKKIPPKEKQAILNDMKGAQKSMANVQCPENVKLVTAKYDKLAAALQEDEEEAAPPPPTKGQKK